MKAARFSDVQTPRGQQDVAPPLVIAFGMVMLDIFAQRSPQRALAEQNYLGQTLLFYRSDPPLRIGIQIRTACRQNQWFAPA